MPHWVYRRAERVVNERLEAIRVDWADVGAAVDVGHDEMQVAFRGRYPQFGPSKTHAAFSSHGLVEKINTCRECHRPDHDCPNRNGGGHRGCPESSPARSSRAPGRCAICTAVKKVRPSTAATPGLAVGTLHPPMTGFGHLGLSARYRVIDGYWGPSGARERSVFGLGVRPGIRRSRSPREVVRSEDSGGANGGTTMRI